MGPDYKDYYKTLGVSKTASEKEIKSAYRKLARKWHPDVNPGSKAAEDKFKEISEAHEVLADADKRAKYDQFGDQWKAYSQAGAQGFPGGASGAGGFPPAGFHVEYGGGGPGAAGGMPGNLNDLFASLFGGMDGFGGGKGQAGQGFPRQRPAPQRGQDVNAELSIALEDAFHGATKALTLTLPGGRYDMDRGGRQNGDSRRVEVKVPAGIADGQKLRLAGQGMGGPGGAGDLHLTVKIAPHSLFERKGDDLTVEVPVPFSRAALGGEIAVPTLSGPRLTVKLPAGAQSGQALRLGGQGMPRLKDAGRGDLYARIKITVPKSLTDRQRELISELATLEG